MCCVHLKKLQFVSFITLEHPDFLLFLQSQQGLVSGLPRDVPPAVSLDTILSSLCVCQNTNELINSK